MNGVRRYTCWIGHIVQIRALEAVYPASIQVIVPISIGVKVRRSVAVLIGPVVPRLSRTRVHQRWVHSARIGRLPDTQGITPTSEHSIG